MKSKKKLIIIIATVLILIGLFLSIFYFKEVKNKEESNDLRIEYVKGDTIVLEDIEKGFTYEKEIIVENTSKELRTYSLEWTSVSNKVKSGSDFTYEITGTGDRSASLGKSQVPGVASKIFNQVAILGGVTHKYKIKITYNGEEKGNFKGVLKVKAYDMSSDKNDKKIDMEKEIEKRKEEKESSLKKEA
ncbi:MAG: hypothetical protein ACI31R_01095 [Bacilli bacterium]